MNNQNTQTNVYAQKVDLLLRLLPLVIEEQVLTAMREFGQPVNAGKQPA